MLIKPFKDQITRGPPPDNRVSGPVSCGKGQSTLGQSTRERPGKGHSTHELPGQDHSTLGPSTGALPDTRHQPQGKGSSTLGYSTRTHLSNGHSTHQLPGQGLDSGSLDQRAARQGSLDSGLLNPNASQEGSLNPPVAGKGSLDSNQCAARQETRSAEQGSLNPHDSP